jgi:pyrroline-5-carboxylate reductase
MNNESGILLVGCGNMGRALVKGWLADGRPAERIQVVDPSPDAAQAALDLGVKSITDIATAESPVDIVIFAVKPQQLETIVPHYRDLADAGTLILSIAAGKPISFYERILGDAAAIVRAMPNTPAAIGQGMTVLSSNASVTAEQLALCESLMAAVGEVAWLADEALMDVVTAVSGSGPAYIFFLIECLTDAAIELGLDEELGRQLAQKTVAGAGAYALVSDEDAAELRRKVTSPGGTTEAALEILMGKDGLRSLMLEAVRSASRRGRELA